jgi:hypothetical protein
MDILSHQQAIAQALGNQVVVANTDSGAAIAEIVSSGADLSDTLKTTLDAAIPA